jgi:hypothetical protein
MLDSKERTLWLLRRAWIVGLHRAQSPGVGGQPDAGGMMFLAHCWMG